MKLSLAELAVVSMSALYQAELGSALSTPRSPKVSARATADRRSFLMTSAGSALGAITAVTTTTVAPVLAAPEIFSTPNGVKYAILQDSKEKTRPANGDIVAIEYTGYLTDGTIFDATHSQGKKNALMFEVGGNAVIPGINEVVKELVVGEKVQAIIPPSLAFGEKGICLESGECLVKPGATLVYDIYLKRSAIPPP